LAVLPAISAVLLISWAARGSRLQDRAASRHRHAAVRRTATEATQATEISRRCGRFFVRIVFTVFLPVIQ